MRPELILVFLCALLLKVGGTTPSMAANAHSKTTGLHSVTYKGSELVADHQRTSYSAIQAEDDYHYLITDDAEDEDYSSSIARKFTLIFRVYPDLTDAGSIVPNCSKPAPAFFGRISYRYLVQRVLRV
jgi:hypothetical protein